MIAKNDNGEITIYPQAPDNYTLKSGGLIMGFHTLTQKEQQAEGFFEVVTPQIDPYTQYLGAIYFDENALIFTYPVLTLAEPLTPPAPELYKSQNEMIRRFTVAEFTGILTAAKSNVFIEYWVFRFNALTKTGVNILDPETIEGVNQLEAAGLIGKGRAAEILAA